MEVCSLALRLGTPWGTRKSGAYPTPSVRQQNHAAFLHPFMRLAAVKREPSSQEVPFCVRQIWCGYLPLREEERRWRGALELRPPPVGL